ncbi:MAG: hypothetical protein IPN77_04735 [Sandaracinaceae bacterium]|nr:hypothetical protein [Sandaracinaceae bacterium]
MEQRHAPLDGDGRAQRHGERADHGGFVHNRTRHYRYDAGYTPDFPGMERFAGQIIHPQAWSETLTTRASACWSSAAAPRP